MDDVDNITTIWRTASYSGNSGNCAEVGNGVRVVLVRDTTDRDAGMLTFTADVWARFTLSLRRDA